MARKQADEKLKLLATQYIGNIEPGDDNILYYREIWQREDAAPYAIDTAIANHVPEPVERRIVDDGLGESEELLYKVWCCGKSLGTFTLTKKDILSATPNLNFPAECLIVNEPGAKAKYAEYLLSRWVGVEPKREYRRIGYVDTAEGRAFLNGNRSVLASGLTDKLSVNLVGQLANYRFVEGKSPERYETLLTKFLAIGSAPLVFASLGFVFLTAVNALLRDLGIEPGFELYYTGRSGVRKTALATVVLNFNGTFPMNGASPPASYRDTANSIERKAFVVDSAPLLLDDADPDNRRNNSEVEKQVIRFIGNRAPRDRLDKNAQGKAAYVPRCGMFTTAEDAYSGISESGIARTIAVEIKHGDIDLAALAEVQAKNEHLNQCFAEYIQYILQNWDALKETLKPLFLDLRAKAQGDGHGRTSEITAYLQIGITTMTDWLVSIGKFDKKQAAIMKEKSWCVFRKLAAQHQDRIIDEKPTTLFLNAVREMRDRKTIRIVPVKQENNLTNSSVVGFFDEKHFYFFADSLYAEVRKFYAAQERSFPVTLSALQRHLRDEGLIAVNPKDKQNTRAKSINGKLIRLLWLHADALDEKEDNSDE